MKLNLSKEETKSLYEGLDHLVYLEPMVKKEDKKNLYKIFEKVRKEVKGKWISMKKKMTVLSQSRIY